jgi:hypothetical protein
MVTSIFATMVLYQASLFDFCEVVISSFRSIGSLWQKQNQR